MARGKKQKSEQDVENSTMDSAAPDTTIVVPCYNEAGRLRSDDFLSFARDTPETHLLFVNDGSTDDTLRVLNKLQTSLPEQASVTKASCSWFPLNPPLRPHS